MNFFLFFSGCPRSLFPKRQRFLFLFPKQRVFFIISCEKSVFLLKGSLRSKSNKIHKKIIQNISNIFSDL